jgi:hypothetical protein
LHWCAGQACCGVFGRCLRRVLLGGVRHTRPDLWRIRTGLFEGRVPAADPDQGAGLPYHAVQGIPDCAAHGVHDFATQGLPDCAAHGVHDFATQGLPDCADHGVHDIATQGLPDCAAHGVHDFSTQGLHCCRAAVRQVGRFLRSLRSEMLWQCLVCNVQHVPWEALLRVGCLHLVPCSLQMPRNITTAVFNGLRFWTGSALTRTRRTVRSVDASRASMDSIANTSALTPPKILRVHLACL